MELKGSFNVKDGVVESGKGNLSQVVKQLKDGWYKWVITKQYSDRSINQNAFYWGVFIPAEIEILKEEGYIFPNAEAVHEWNKDNFNRKCSVNIQTGEVYSYPASTAKENTVEFEEFLMRIRSTFLDNYNAALPYPNE